LLSDGEGEDGEEEGVKREIWSGSYNGHLGKTRARFKACSTKTFHVHTQKSMPLGCLGNFEINPLAFMCF